MIPKTRGDKENRWMDIEDLSESRRVLFKFLCGKTICEMIRDNNDFSPKML